MKLLIVFSLIPLFNLLTPGLPVTHDGQDHVARIANFYLSLSEGNMIPRWAGNLNWGYGHPILMFLYPLPSYIASFFHAIGFSLVDSTKIVFGLGMVLSTIFMYLWLASFLNRSAALFGAALYTYAPYRFVEIYVRGDIGENLAFAFIPLVLLFAHRIYKYNKFTDAIWGSFSLALLILSHNAISLMLMPFILLYFLILIYLSKEKNKIFMNLLSLFIMGFGLSAFFWIPGLFEGKYTLRNIVTKGEYLKRFVSFKDFIYGPGSFIGAGELTFQFGPLSWLSIIAAPFVFLKFKKEKEKFYLLALLLVFLSIAVFLMLPVSNFIWSRVLLLQNFQFPWRFLAIVVFTTAVLGALFLEAIPKKYKMKLSLVLIIMIMILGSFYLRPKEYLQKPDSFYTGIYKSTTDTGESAPIWSIRFMEKEPRSNLEVIDGDAKIENLERKSTYHKYKVIVDRETILRENTLYFPGWEMRANGKPIEVRFQVPYKNGTMEFSLDKGSYIIESIYKETKLRLFADVISSVTLGNLIGGLLIIIFIKLKSNKFI